MEKKSKILIDGVPLYFTVKCLVEPIHRHLNLPEREKGAAKLVIMRNGDTAVKKRGNKKVITDTVLSSAQRYIKANLTSLVAEWAEAAKVSPEDVRFWDDSAVIGEITIPEQYEPLYLVELDMRKYGLNKAVNKQVALMFAKSNRYAVYGVIRESGGIFIYFTYSAKYSGGEIVDLYTNGKSVGKGRIELITALDDASYLCYGDAS